MRFTDRKSEGFTFLELLLSMALMGIVALVVAGALRLGIQAWMKGDRKISAMQPSRLVVERIKRQLSSALPYKMRLEGTEQVVFWGTADQLRFVSVGSLFAGNKHGVYLIKYQIDASEPGQKRFLVAEKNLSTVDKSDETIAIDFPEQREMVNGFEILSFSYAEGLDDEGNAAWTDEWNGHERMGLPLAVKIIMKKSGDAPSIETTIRLPITMVSFLPAIFLQYNLKVDGASSGWYPTA